MKSKIEVIGEDEVSREKELREQTRDFLNELIEREGEMLLGKSIKIVEDEIRLFKKSELG